MASTCLICDGGPGNECACTCPNGPTYEVRAPIAFDPTSSPLRRQQFADDWNAMVAHIAEFSAKWNLPKPEMVYHSRVLHTMREVSEARILDTLISHGVKIRFGTFSLETVFREG